MRDFVTIAKSKEIYTRLYLINRSFLNFPSFPLKYGLNRRIKRCFDLIFSTVAILLFLIVIPIIALLIKLDSKGPVFFVQKRTKRGGRYFNCIKFRTMIVNEDADILPAVVDDQRITSVGKTLRKYHIDELPQLFNVFWGDMSVIGPRPYMISDNDKFEVLVPHFSTRNSVKPGITGLAQVLGYAGPIEDEKNMNDRVNYDLYYIHRWSVRLDLKICLRTFRKMLGKKSSLVLSAFHH